MRKEKIGIEKITFHYIALESREQQLAKIPLPPHPETLCQNLAQLGETEPLVVGYDVTPWQNQPMYWWDFC